MQRVLDGGWQVIYNLSERWVKDDRDPENVVYESICYTVEHQLTTGALDRYNCSTSQHLKLLHDDTQYLLAMAFADKALYGIESPAELWKMDIPDGDDELPLRWNDEVLDLPIVRQATRLMASQINRFRNRPLSGSLGLY